MESSNNPTKRIKEIEVKYKLTPEAKNALIANLKKIGAKYIESKIETDIYYSRPDSDFMKTRECLRIRYTPAYTELTYKPGTTEHMLAKQRFWKKEVNLRINDQFDVARELLRDLEFIELVTVEKSRDLYKIYDVDIAIDYIKDLGWFSELEIQTDDEFYALQTLESYELQLGFKEDDIVAEPYRDLLLSHINK